MPRIPTAASDSAPCRRGPGAMTSRSPSSGWRCDDEAYERSHDRRPARVADDGERLDPSRGPRAGDPRHREEVRVHAERDHAQEGRAGHRRDHVPGSGPRLQGARARRPRRREAGRDDARPHRPRPRRPLRVPVRRVLRRRPRGHGRRVRRRRVGEPVPDLGFYHPIVIHFAIGLLAGGVILRGLSLIRGGAFAGPAAAVLILLATAAIVLAARSGEDAHVAVEAAPGIAGAVRAHQRWGERTRNVALLAAGFELLTLAWRSRKASFVAAAVGVLALLCVVETGKLGGELVYAHAGGVGIRSEERSV